MTHWSCLLLVVFSLAGLVACDGGDLEHRESSASAFGLGTGSASVSSAPELLQDVESHLTLGQLTITGASADGAYAKVRVPYTAHAPADWFSRSRVELHLSARSDSTVLSSAVVDIEVGEQSGDVLLTVPANLASFEFLGNLYQPRYDRIVHSVSRNGSLDLDFLQEPATLPVKGSQIFPVLVPGSYHAQTTGNRRVHRFSLQVFDRHPEDPERISIAGLQSDASRFFKAYEGGFHDVESPVEVDASRTRIQIYFVLDASYSIVASGAEELLTQAAVRTVLALRDVAAYDYRQFSNSIRGLDQIDDMTFDGSTSATAFYLALDDTLQDIENYSNTTDQKIIVAFTDGRDFASLNHYPEIATEAAMEAYITGRVRQVRDDQAAAGGGLQLHVVSVADADTRVLDRLAIEGDGVHQSALEWSGVGSAFAQVARQIHSTYYLEYSSQRVVSDLPLEIEVRVNDQPARVTIKP